MVELKQLLCFVVTPDINASLSLSLNSPLCRRPLCFPAQSGPLWRRESRTQTLVRTRAPSGPHLLRSLGYSCQTDAEPPLGWSGETSSVVFHRKRSCRGQVRSPWRRALSSQPGGSSRGSTVCLGQILILPQPAQGSALATPTAQACPITAVLVEQTRSSAWMVANAAGTK